VRIHAFDVCVRICMCICMLIGRIFTSSHAFIHNAIQRRTHICVCYHFVSFSHSIYLANNIYAHTHMHL
jgi:hypothetical protein